jgi:hypothetical protein
LRFNGFRGSLLLLVSIAVNMAAAPAPAPGKEADKDKSAFEVKAALSYPHHQTSETITIAAEPFETDEQTHEAFGKVNPWRYGVLPVLIVMQNDGPNAIRVDRMKLIYTLPDQSRVEATPAQDLKYLRGASEPHGIPGPTGGIKITRPPKNPLAEWEIEGRAFAAKMIPPGQSASGFVYFQIAHTSAAASVYISGLENAVTGKELYYFEIPMSGK